MPEIQDTNELLQLLDECQTTLGYRFENLEMLAHCLTHASAARTRIWSNERLEFLGDAILGTIVCESLYHRFPDAAEGEMTRIKSIVVSRVTCAILAERIQLERFVIFGKGLGGTSGRIPPSILAGTFESLIAGIYLDGGFEAVRSFLEPLVTPEIDNAAASLHAQNYKSLLQHVAQKTLGATPIYRLLNESGPDHLKRFQVSAVIGGRVFPSAWGQNKKEAEQIAAQNAIEELQSLPARSLEPAEPETSPSSEPLPASLTPTTAVIDPDSYDQSSDLLKTQDETSGIVW